MTQDADAHATEDSKRKEEAEARNNADNLAYSAEKTMRDLGDKVPADMRQEVEGKIAAVRSALQGQDTDQLRRTSEELSESLQKVGSTVYQQADPSSGESGSPEEEGEPQPPSEGDEGAVEGEFREV